jgi:uncharacterized membrane protein
LSTDSKKCVYCPHNYGFFAILFLILAIVVGLIFLGVLSFAFSGVGFSPVMVIAILAGTFFGSFINIPLVKLKSQVPVVKEEFVSFLGLRYRIPRVEYSTTVTTLAINVGGALIPAAVSIYLLAQAAQTTIVYSIIGVVIVAAITRLVARPVKGVGIVTPALIPPLAAAITAILIAPGSELIVAYVSGVLGTLIGADLLNLGRIRNLGAPVASIGGAGTFDGVFLSGIIAVLLAAI